MGRPIHKKYFGNLSSSGIGGESVSSIAVGSGGGNTGYTEIPVLTIAAPDIAGGVQATASAHMAVNAITNLNGGTSGYVPAQILTLTGGTGTKGTITVTTTSVNVPTLNNPGSGYAPSDVLTVAAGTSNPASTITVTATQVKTATVVAGGDGYAVGDVVELTTGTTSTDDAQFTVTSINDPGETGSGPVTGVELVNTVKGTYTVNPTLTPSPTSKRSGAGNDALTLGLTMEIKTIELTAAGSFTVNPPSLTGVATTVAPPGGTGATLDLTMKVNTASVTTGGDYTVLPTDITIVGHTGGGTGATFNLTFKVLSAEVTASGSGYATTPVITADPNTIPTTGYTITMTATNDSAILTSANVTGAGAKSGDIVKQESSRRYLVTTADGTGQCMLVAAAPSAVGQMTLTAKDSANGTYYVTKLTARRAVIVKGDRSGTQFTTGADGISVPWVFATSAVQNESVEIVSA